MTVLERLKNDGVKVVEKRGWFWSVLNALVFVVSLGKNKSFLSNYYTTIGSVVGVPRGLSPKNADDHVLFHEWEHVKQCRAFGFGNAWLGLPIFGLLYVFVPLPFGLAWCRYYFERNAYKVGIDYKLNTTKGLLPSGLAKLREALITHAVEQLTGSSYAWTWPFKKSVRKWFENNVVDHLQKLGR